MGGFWREMSRLIGKKLMPNSSYHPQTDGKTEIMNKWLEGYLRNYVSGKHKAWIKWIHLGEHCYNTTYHMSIGMTHFKDLYGYDAPTFVDRAFGDSRAPKEKDWIQECQDILQTLKDNLQMTHNQQKMYVDKNRVECSFEVRDLVYRRFQPYKQSSLKMKGLEKLKPQLYGPCRILRRVREVSYELELREGCKIHNVFHVSCLKKAMEQHVVTSIELPPLDEEG
jgi:hypothetical protein